MIWIGGRAPSRYPAGDCLAFTERMRTIGRGLSKNLIGLLEFQVHPLKRFNLPFDFTENVWSGTLSTSGFLTHLFSAWAELPILTKIEEIVAQREECSASCSRTTCTTGARTSGEYLFVSLLILALLSQELKPPASPARFRITSRSGLPHSIHSSEHLYFL